MLKRVHVALIALLMLPGLLPAQQPAASEATAQPYAIDPQTPQGLQRLFRYTGESLPLVSAHRGGPQPGFPENCIATFENTLRQTFAILEVDPRYTRDGAIVIHHDETLDRTTTGSGPIAQLDLRELKQLRLKDQQGHVTGYQIPTLDEVLEWARGRTILVLDQKDVPVEARVRKIEEHRAASYAMMIVYSLEGVRECYSLNKDIVMEVMITNREQFEAFDKTGVPWSNIVAFVGHQPPRDAGLLRMIHEKGACCIAGTSRNLDRQLAAVGDQSTATIEADYRKLLQSGVDLIETDLAGRVGRLLYDDARIPSANASMFHRR
ncbi:MAG: glycerophosphodiester phosphodiesterase family protein [Pirellulales bacterium]